MTVTVVVRVRVGGHLTRVQFTGPRASADHLGHDGAVLTMYDSQDRPTVTTIWPTGVVDVTMTRIYD